jgi:hypothetical protein
MQLPSIKPLSPKFSKLASAMMLVWSCTTFAAEHPLTKVHYDETAKVNTVDLVMSLDWDINNPPAGRDKNYIEGILKQTSQSLYAMTEGRLRLGKVSVYSNKQFMDNTDIQYLFKNGRANASISGFNSGKGMTIEMFSETGENAIDQGKTIAHELGHYLLGIFDEYREEGKKSDDPSAPQDGDTPRDTIMQDHLQFETISTPSDYVDPAMRNTAHFRVYKQSAWETLISPNGNEPEGYPKRLQLQALQGLTPPDTASLTKPKTGWEAALQVTYMGANESSAPTQPSGDNTPRSTIRQPGPINVIVLDTTVAKPQLDAQINAAQQLIDAAGSNVSVAVYTYPYASDPVVPLTVVADTTVKTNLRTALNKVTLAATDDDISNGDRLFDWAETSLPNLFPAGEAKSTADSGYYYRFYASTGQAVGVNNGHVYYYDGKTIADIGAIADWLPKSRLDLSASLQQVMSAIQSVQTPADTPAITLLTTAEHTVSTDIANHLADAGIGVNPVVLATHAPRTKPRYTATREATTSLYDLADMTHGTFSETTKESEWARDAVRAMNNTEGDDLELVADWGDMLTAGNSAELLAQIADGIDKTIRFQTYWEDVDAAKISYTLVDPKGLQITPTTLPEGVTYVSEPDEGSVTYIVSAMYANHEGAWKSIVTASEATEEAVFQEVSTESNLFSELEIIGGTQADQRPMVALMKVEGPLAVHGAKVTADIYSANSGEMVQSVTLLDDGVAPDTRQADGIYSAALSSLPVDEYEIEAKAIGDGTAVFSTSGATKKGINQPDEVIPAFQRATFSNFKKEL